MSLLPDDAVEVIPATNADSPATVTCEHATERLPAPWQWPAADAWLHGTHWAYDPGAADLARGIAAKLGAATVLSRFSRLLVDPNREDTDPELIRTWAEGREVSFNRGIHGGELERRLPYWRAYHDAVTACVTSSTAAIVLSMHTFTPVYEGHVREVEVGILFNEEEALALRVGAAIAETGLCVRMNEPYSGRGGLIYSAERHARAHGRRALEIEVRQDLAVIPEIQERVIVPLAEVLRG